MSSMGKPDTVSSRILLAAAALLGKKRKLDAVNPELYSPILLFPSFIHPWTRNAIQGAVRRLTPKVPGGLRVATHQVEGSAGDPPVKIVIIDREGSSGVRPVIYWMHGGGYVVGRAEQDFQYFQTLLDALDVVIVSVDYRLAPEHPFPAALDDSYEGLRWVLEHSADLQIDPSRLVIAGQSAGGGLAAALVQKVADQGLAKPVLQLLIYPMLDAMTTAKTDHAGTGNFIWTPASNKYGWQSYLGANPGSGKYPAYAVPAARENLDGLPPAWLGVGTLDLFYSEDCRYAERLQASGVACDLHIEKGAYHGFDVLHPNAVASRRFQQTLCAAVKRALA